MTRPTFLASVAFGSNPLDDPQVYTAIPSMYLESIKSVKRGRQRLLDRVETGTAQLRFWDKDRRFDPKNSGSPYAPNIIPRRRLLIQVQDVPGLPFTPFPVFGGFIDSWQPVYQNRERYADVHASDAFTYFSRTKVDFASGREQSDGRIHRILNALGWPASQRIISGGQTTVEGGTWIQANALQSLQDVATTENGVFFIGREGLPVFLNRWKRLTDPTSTISQATFGDANVSSELPFVSITDADDDSLLANRVTTTLGGVTAGLAQDSASQLRYMIADLTRELPLLTSYSEGQSAAEWIAKQRANLLYRVESITLDGDASDAVLLQMCIRDIGNRITIKQYPDKNPLLTPWVQDFYIESVSWDLTRQAPRCTWTLSVVDFDNYFRADDPIYGRADYNAAAY